MEATFNITGPGKYRLRNGQVHTLQKNQGHITFLGQDFPWQSAEKPGLTFRDNGTVALDGSPYAFDAVARADSELKLEAGKYYRTSNGRKAYVAAINMMLPDCEELRTVGYIPYEDGNGVIPTIWWSNGQASNSPSLIAEWVEPKRIKGKMFIFETNIGVHGSYICADPDKKPGLPIGAKPLACIEIDVLEGQGLDGSDR